MVLRLRRLSVACGRAAGWAGLVAVVAVLGCATGAWHHPVPAAAWSAAITCLLVLGRWIEGSVWVTASIGLAIVGVIALGYSTRRPGTDGATGARRPTITPAVAAALDGLGAGAAAAFLLVAALGAALDPFFFIVLLVCFALLPAAPPPRVSARLAIDAALLVLAAVGVAGASFLLVLSMDGESLQLPWYPDASPSPWPLVAGAAMALLADAVSRIGRSAPPPRILAIASLAGGALGLQKGLLLGPQMAIAAAGAAVLAVSIAFRGRAWGLSVVPAPGSPWRTWSRECALVGLAGMAVVSTVVIVEIRACGDSSAATVERFGSSCNALGVAALDADRAVVGLSDAPYADTYRSAKGGLRPAPVTVPEFDQEPWLFAPLPDPWGAALVLREGPTGDARNGLLVVQSDGARVIPLVDCNPSSTAWDSTRGLLLLLCQGGTALFGFDPATGTARLVGRIRALAHADDPDQDSDDHRGRLWVVPEEGALYVREHERLFELDIHDLSQRRELPVRGHTGDLAYDPVLRELHLARPFESSILVLDAQTHAVRRRSRVAFGVHHLDALPGRRLLAVSGRLHAGLRLLTMDDAREVAHLALGLHSAGLAAGPEPDVVYAATSCGSFAVDLAALVPEAVGRGSDAP